MLASTPSDHGELIKAKWLSVDNHIHNVHCNHGEIFPRCQHAQLKVSHSKRNGVVEINLLLVCTGEISVYTRSSYPEAVSTLHCALENGANLHVNERQMIRHYRARSTEERRFRRRRRKKNANSRFFTSPSEYVNLRYIAVLCTHLIGNQP